MKSILTPMDGQFLCLLLIDDRSESKVYFFFEGIKLQVGKGKTWFEIIAFLAGSLFCKTIKTLQSTVIKVIGC